MDITTFSSLLCQAVQKVFPHATLNVSVIRSTRLKARIELSEERFVDVFFHEETQRTDYALIVARKRVFGLDNLRGWHRHSVENPSQHISCPEPTPQEAMKQIQEVLEIYDF